MELDLLWCPIASKMWINDFCKQTNNVGSLLNFVYVDDTCNIVPFQLLIYYFPYVRSIFVQFCNKYIKLFFSENK